MLKTFEAAIHNQDVRDAVARGEHHPFYLDEWANRHLVEITAATQHDALATLRRRYPPSKGFQIEGLKALKEFI